MTLFFLFGLSIATFIFLLTLVKRNKNNADYTLAAWMGFMTMHLAFFVLDYSKVIYEYPHLLGILLPLPIHHGLFLYCYTLQITTDRFPGGKAIFLHLIPFFLLVILAIPFYTLSGEQKVLVFLSNGKGYEWCIRDYPDPLLSHSFERGSSPRSFTTDFFGSADVRKISKKRPDGG